MNALSSFAGRPFLDALRGLERCLVAGGRGLAATAAGLLASYLLYVPLHELAHAFACLAAGGSVSRLEVQPIFGGGLLAKAFPWVVPGGEYAGRLVGFDTGGNDLVYLATDLGPFLLTILPGVWWLRRAARAGSGFLFGAGLPFALAPFLSLTGDAYEIGSILTTQLPPWWHGPLATSLRADDLLRLVPTLGGGGVLAWAGALVGTLLGTVWAFGTYGLGSWVAGRLGQPALQPTGESGG